MNYVFIIKLRQGEVQSGVFNKTFDQLGWVLKHEGGILNAILIIK